jgi:hypothetical protein
LLQVNAVKISVTTAISKARAAKAYMGGSVVVRSEHG